jgi:hypothetical protein
MKTIDEMLHLDLLTHEQHLQISHWIDDAQSPSHFADACRTLAGRGARQPGHGRERGFAAPALDAGGLTFSQ